ncbi:hypothetical protein MXB_3862 [Myxobolus squamalis]|nr:hypothetical protein MXB_3862 [Myxobolus squamalis]
MIIATRFEKDKPQYTFQPKAFQRLIILLSDEAVKRRFTIYIASQLYPTKAILRIPQVLEFGKKGLTIAVYADDLGMYEFTDFIIAEMQI